MREMALRLPHIGDMASTFLQDLRYGLRIALGSLGFTSVAVLTLALGIAVNTTVFSWTDMMLLRPVPGVPNSGELATLESVSSDGVALPTSFPDFRDFRDRLKLLSGLAAAVPATMTMGEGNHADRVWAELVSPNYFAVLGVKPTVGRMFSQSECGDKADACPVAVIGDGLWKSRFHGDRNIIGSTVVLNRQHLTVIGIAPAQFRGSLPGLTLSIWAPLNMGARLNVFSAHGLESSGTRNLMGIARLRPGLRLAQARAECSALGRQIARLGPSANAGVGATLLPIREGHFGAQRMMAGPLGILMAVCCLVFLIVCANVSSLLLARSIARRMEFSVRLAMGASRGRLARQLLSETLILAVLGVLAGVALATWMSQSLGYLMPGGGSIPLSLDIPLNGEILAFTALLCAAACVISGIVPALHGARADLNEALKEGGRSGGEGERTERTRGLLVISEVALALIAIIGTGLFARSFQVARQINPGFDPRNVLVSTFELASAGYSGPNRLQFCERLRDRLASQPGIAGVSWADVVPLWFTGNPWASWDEVQVEGYVAAEKESMKILRSVVEPGYLELMRIPMVEGRDFTRQDDENASPVIVVNQTFARHFFGDHTAIGRKVRVWDRWFTIAGVARDSKYVSPSEAPTRYFYAPSRQVSMSPVVQLFVRKTGKPEQAVAAVRSAAHFIDPGIAVFAQMPLTESIGASLFGQKMSAVMLGVLGVVAVVLAATGIYSVMAYSVAQRTREIGIRMALGARPADGVALVMRRGIRLTLFGIALGAMAALAVTRLIASLLLNVSPADPLVFAGASVFLAAVALAANYLPARRATHIDPNDALRRQ
jgi:predicted permease